MYKYILIALIIILGFITLIQIKNQEPQTTTIDEQLTEKNTQPEYQSVIDINYLRSLNIESDAPVIEQELTPGSNYKRYIASYISSGNKIYGLLTIPTTQRPDEGYPAIVFNHGYIPPTQYKTTEKYIAYVDSLARNGYVVFKIDLRGNGDSEGHATGSYFSPGYTIDAISAVKSLQMAHYVNKGAVGMWGHSMAGNLVLRALLIDNEIKAAVIWAGAVYSYEDFAKYRLHDSSYVSSQPDPHYDASELSVRSSSEVSQLRQDPESVDFNDPFWSTASLTQNIKYLQTPIQLNHAVNDPVVNIGYSRDLVDVLKQNNKTYEFFEYPGGGHNIESPFFEQAMQHTIEFFDEYLK